ARRRPCPWRRRARGRRGRRRPRRRGTGASGRPGRRRAAPRSGRSSGRAARTASRRRFRESIRVLSDDLERIAAAASAHGAVTAVLPAEPALAGVRLYLVSFGEDDGREWLVVDDDGRPVGRREAVRDTASIVVMCEL